MFQTSQTLENKLPPRRCCPVALHRWPGGLTTAISMQARNTCHACLLTGPGLWPNGMIDLQNVAVRYTASHPQPSNPPKPLKQAPPDVIVPCPMSLGCAGLIESIVLFKDNAVPGGWQAQILHQSPHGHTEKTSRGSILPHGTEKTSTPSACLDYGLSGHNQASTCGLCRINFPNLPNP